MLIHGIVAHGAPRDLQTEALSAMLDGVSPTPWSVRCADSWEDRETRCSLAAQGDDASQARIATLGPLVAVADLDLHGPEELSPREGGGRLERGGLDLLLTMLARRGPQVLDEMRAEGALAVWDRDRSQMLLWRDPAGARPLYFHLAPGRHFVFSSDPRALLASGLIGRHLDLPYARSLLSDPHFQHPTRTLIEGVRKVPPAHSIETDLRSLRPRRYWQPSVGSRPTKAPPHVYAEQVRDAVRTAVRRRCGSSGLVGAHLSGGLDSSSIASLAAQEVDGTVHAYSWSPARSAVSAVENDERDLVDAVAEHAGIQVCFSDLSVEDVLSVLRRDIALEPVATLHPEVATSRAAAQAGIRRILSGWGGDESIVFNGRGLFADLARRGRLLRVHREFRARQRLVGGSMLGAWRGRVILPLLPGPVAGRLRPDLQELPRPEPPAVLTRDFADALRDVEPLPSTDLREKPGVHRLQRQLLDYGHLAFRMESWASHGAGLGLRYSFPLLDRDVVELALRLPPELYFRDGWKRYIYRVAMEGVLPDRVRWHHDKREFAATQLVNTARAQAQARLREELRDRGGGGLLDVDRYLDDARERDDAAAGAYWLAFTGLRPR